MKNLNKLVRDVIKESVVKQISEANFDLGKNQYTAKNLTPTQILDLAFAYTQTPLKQIIGNKYAYRVHAANDLAILNGTRQLDAKQKGKNPALIVSLLKNSLVTKDEYIKLYKDLIEKQIQVIKALKNSSAEMRNTGGSARVAAMKAMRGEFEMGESVNEANKSGDKLTHKHNPNIEIELIEPTNKGWKVYQIEKGKKKIAYFDKQDISGDRALFESVNEAPLGKKRFMFDFYTDSFQRNTERETNYISDSLESAIKAAEHICKVTGYGYVEIYYKDLFLGSMKEKNKFEFVPGKGYSKFKSVNEVSKKIPLFIPNVGNIDDFKLKSLLQKNPRVKTILGDKEFKFLNQDNTDVIMVSGKPYNSITTDGKLEFELDLKKNILVKPLGKARPKIVAHYSQNESVNEGAGTLTIEKRKDGKYYWQYKFKSGKTEDWPEGFNTKADAQKDFIYRSKYIKESVNEGDENSPEEILSGLREMAFGDLERIADYANMIETRMKEGQELDSWMYSQITLAVDQLNSVHDTMDGRDGEREPMKENADYKYLTKIILDANPKHNVYYNDSWNVVNIGGTGYDKGDLSKQFNQTPGSASTIKNNFYYANQDPQKTKREIEKLSNGKIKVNINKGIVYYSLDESVNEEKPGLWANIRAKRARGEKPAHGNSDAHKDAVKAGKKINNEETITEKQFKGIEGIPANKKLSQLSDAEKIKILQASGNIIDFIVPDWAKGTRNFWQVISKGSIKKKKNLGGDIIYFLPGKMVQSPAYSSVKELLNGVDWDSMEERRKFNESAADVTEMGTTDVHFKNILRMYDTGGSFTKKKVAVVVCNDSKATRTEIMDAMREMDYEEISDAQVKLGISKPKN
jgi:hypothetical protein